MVGSSFVERGAPLGYPVPQVIAVSVETNYSGCGVGMGGGRDARGDGCNAR